MSGFEGICKLGFDGLAIGVLMYCFLVSSFVGGFVGCV